MTRASGRVPRRISRSCIAAAALAGLAQAQPLPYGSPGTASFADPWDAPSVIAQAGTGQAAAQSYGGLAREVDASPLIIGGMEFSREDDIGNMDKLSNTFGHVFYTSIMAPGDASIQEAWRGLSTDIWALASYAEQVPALALSVAMCLYNYFWWEGPHTMQPNAYAGYRAAELMYMSVVHARCNDPAMPGMDYYIRQCHLRWRYTLMLAGEVGRHLVLQKRDLISGARVLRMLCACFAELRRLPNSGLLHGVNPHEVNFNADYYPAAVMRQGPVWKNPLQDLPVAAFLEANFPTIRAELDAMLAVRGTFQSLDEQTRNAETQFGPRGDDWQTAYMFRKGEAIAGVCKHAPRTCALLSTRPEIAGCRVGGSGAGFLRMSPGGRLKPHFGNAPRLSVHLGLIVPKEDIRMNVGYESVRWEEGKVIVFDDTFIHQVVHNGVEPRYVMNLWMCHPCDPEDGKLPGEAVPAYCQGEPGAMTRLGLVPLPPPQT